MELELQEIGDEPKLQKHFSKPDIGNDTEVDDIPTIQLEDDENAVWSPCACPVDLTWENLTYTVRVGRKKRRTLTNNLTGMAKAGEMCAVMGPSGAGKSTLLNLLAKRTYGGKVEGKILANGEELNQSAYRKITGFVSQDDIMFPLVTVKETLAFSAFLRLPRSMPYSEKVEKVKVLAAKLGLNKCINTRIGNSLFRGVSGGERKRVNIGREIITDPSVVFLDEPTTGLDAFTSLLLIKLLHNLAHKENRTLIMTIHQPRADIFYMFDQLLLLASGGDIAYYGPARTAEAYFAGLGFQVPPFVNPSDYFLDVMTPDTKTPERQAKRAAQIANITDYYKANKVAEQEKRVATRNTGGLPPIQPQALIHTQLLFLTLRHMSNMVRNIPLLVVRFSSAIVMGFLIGLLYLQIDNNQKTIQDQLGFLFFTICFLCFNELNAVIAAFPMERAVFLHERSTGTYGVFAYYFSKVIGDIPDRILIPILWSNIAYWLVGLPASRFGYYFLNTIFICNVAASVGLWLGALSKSPETAVAISTTGLIFMMVFGGFFILQQDIPDYFIWFHYLSIYKYHFEIFVINNFEDRNLGCDPATATPTAPCLDGNGVIDSLGMEDARIYINFPALLCFYLGFMTLAFITLKFRRGQ